MLPTDTDYLERLESLLEHPPVLEDLVASMAERFVEYTVERGFAVGHGVLHDNDCAILKLFISAGTVFPVHIHNEYEYIIIVDGEGDYTIDGDTKPFKPLDCVVLKPGQLHTWYYRTNTRQICITIPASKGFPHGEG